MKEEVENLNRKLAELTEEELEQVTGGQINPFIDELYVMDPVTCGGTNPGKKRVPMIGVIPGVETDK